jgi:steroid 5-alpha reductase family enzyme
LNGASAGRATTKGNMCALMLSLAGAGWILAAAVMALLWVWHLRLHNAGIVDGGCAFLVGGLAVLYAVFGSGWAPRRSAIAFMMASWGAHLTVHLLYDRVFGRPEEGRYADQRQRHGGDANAWFFWSFEARAVAAVCFSLPALVAVVNSREGFSPFEFAGAGLWILAFTGEVTADRQLERFKSDPMNRGRACQTGLWRYSRNPNYVFELLVWVAYATYASGSPWGWLAWACPAAMVALPTAICPFGVRTASLAWPSSADTAAKPFK